MVRGSETLRGFTATVQARVLTRFFGLVVDKTSHPAASSAAVMSASTSYDLVVDALPQPLRALFHLARHLHLTRLPLLSSSSSFNYALVYSFNVHITVLYFLHFTRQGQARYKDLARTSRSHVVRDAHLLLVHLVWRKSRSTPRPTTVFTSRCHDAYWTVCEVSEVFPTTGYGGIKKATVWMVGRVLSPLSGG